MKKHPAPQGVLLRTHGLQVSSFRSFASLASVHKSVLPSHARSNQRSVARAAVCSYYTYPASLDTGKPVHQSSVDITLGLSHDPVISVPP